MLVFTNIVMFPYSREKVKTVCLRVITHYSRVRWSLKHIRLRHAQLSGERHRNNTTQVDWFEARAHPGPDGIGGGAT